MSLLGNVVSSIFTGALSGALGGPRGLAAFLSEVQTPSVGDWRAYMGRDPTAAEIAQYGLMGGTPMGTGARIDVYASAPYLEAAAPPPFPLPPPVFPGMRPGAIVPIPPQLPAVLARAARWIVPVVRKYGIVLGRTVWETYQELRARGTSDRIARIEAQTRHLGTVVRRGRRMNPLNPRALRRAITRAHRFADFCQKSGYISKTFTRKPRRARRKR